MMDSATEHHLASGQHFLRWIIPHLAGDDDEKETALVMILGQLRQSYLRGLADAQEVTRRIAEARPTREATIIAGALQQLHERNRSEPPIVAL